MAKPTTSQSLTAGVLIGSRGLELRLIDDAGSVLSSRSAELQTERSIADQIHELLIEDNSSYDALGIAVPGMVDTTGRIAESRLTQLTGLDLRSELGELVDGHIDVVNDANAGAFAERKIGCGKSYKDIFRVTIGDGVGAGLILHGSLWRGSNGFAGEIGSIVVDEEGNRLEDIASIPSIVRRTRNRFHQDSTSILNKLEENEIELKDIIAAAELGDDLALLMFERTGFAIGTAIAAVLNVLNVEAVIIAGEPTRSNPILHEAIKTRVQECTSDRVFENTTILISELDESAAAIGAALLANETK